MANGNGVWRVLAVVALGAVGTTAGILHTDAKDDIGDNKDRIRIVEDRADSAYLQLHRRLDKQELSSTKQDLQLAEIAKGLNRIADAGIPVVVDTTVADTAAEDST